MIQKMESQKYITKINLTPQKLFQIEKTNLTVEP